MSTSTTPSIKFSFSSPISTPSNSLQPKTIPNSFFPPPAPQEDKFYYFQHVIFLVENTLFKVPRHYFEDSPIFSDMFSLPTGDGTPDGMTNDRPLRLDLISKHDFSALLKVICPKHFLRREKLNYLELVSVLKLSTMWEFEDVRRLAIEKLTDVDIDPVNRLELIKMYDVPQWYWTAIRALCEQTKRLDDFDVGRLGVNFSLRIAELRGQIAGYKRAQGRGVLNSDLTVNLIRELFAEEVRDMPLPDGDINRSRVGNRATLGVGTT